MLGNPLVRFWEGQGGNLAIAPRPLDPLKEYRVSIRSGADGVVPKPKHCKNAFRQMAVLEPTRLRL